jgi:hypothetical protein
VRIVQFLEQGAQHGAEVFAPLPPCLQPCFHHGEGIAAGAGDHGHDGVDEAVVDGAYDQVHGLVGVAEMLVEGGPRQPCLGDHRLHAEAVVAHPREHGPRCVQQALAQGGLCFRPLRRPATAARHTGDGIAAAWWGSRHGGLRVSGTAKLN